MCSAGHCVVMHQHKEGIWALHTRAAPFIRRRLEREKAAPKSWQIPAFSRACNALPANKISAQPLNFGALHCIHNIFNIAFNINLTPGSNWGWSHNFTLKSFSIFQINSSLEHSLSSKFVTWFLSPGFLIVKFLMSNFWSIPLGRPTDSFDCKLKLFTGSNIANSQWQSKIRPSYVRREENKLTNISLGG